MITESVLLVFLRTGIRGLLDTGVVDDAQSLDDIADLMSDGLSIKGPIELITGRLGATCATGAKPSTTVKSNRASSSGNNSEKAQTRDARLMVLEMLSRASKKMNHPSTFVCGGSE
jgi:hypothetical protein